MVAWMAGFLGLAGAVAIACRICEPAGPPLPHADQVAALGVSITEALSAQRSGLSFDAFGEGAPSREPQTPYPAYGTRYLEFHLRAGRTLVPFLGDTDLRNEFQVGLIYSKSERWLRTRAKAAELMQELYYEHSGAKGGAGIFGNLPAQYDAVGYLFGARYNWRLRGGRYGLYTDLGWGFQYSDHRTADLPSRLNSTPYLDVGLWIPGRDHYTTLGLRLMHTSNGGTVGPNAGQNQLFLDLGVKF